LRPPLTSNVSPLPRSPREVVVEQSSSASVPALNTNSRALQRWSQQAPPAAPTATAAQLVPSFATHQACAAGPSKSGPPHTPAARCLLPRPALRQALQCKRRRSVGASRGQGKVGSSSRFVLASAQASSRSLSRSRPSVASARLLRSNTRQAKPAAMHWPAVGRRALVTLRANPPVKGTKCGKPHFAPYLER
jgi:hypothetical protein